jgi:hypothetical protein
MLLWHGSGWSTPHLGLILSPEKSPGTNFTGWAEPTVIIGGRRERKVSLLHKGSNPEPFSQSWYTVLTMLSPPLDLRHETLQIVVAIKWIIWLSIVQATAYGINGIVALV